ncbi:hypothetical protein CEN39_17910 [Fischerella thermalis CCMEE 5201]|nr:hypothetical protein CEN39_17910 [Fischerella thermalis CCMEE 5201]
MNVVMFVMNGLALISNVKTLVTNVLMFSMDGTMLVTNVLMLVTKGLDVVANGTIAPSFKTSDRP